MNLLDNLFFRLIDLVLNAMAVFGTSIMEVLRIDLGLFMRIFPIASTSFEIFRHFAITLMILMLVWGLFKNFLLPIGTEADPPFQLVARTAIFAFLAFNAWPITMGIIAIAGTPFDMIVGDYLTVSPVDFDMMHTLMSTMAGIAMMGVAPKLPLVIAIISLIFVVLVGWNFLKLMLEAVERYLLVGVLVFTSPLAFAMGASKSTQPIFQSWCRMLSGQVLLLVFNVWTLRMFTAMIRSFMTNPMMVGW